MALAPWRRDAATPANGLANNAAPVSLTSRLDHVQLGILIQAVGNVHL